MNTNNKNKRVIILGRYPNSEDIITANLDYSVFNSVYMNKLAEIKEYRKYSTTNYLNSEELEAEIQTINQLSVVDTNCIYEVIIS